jgi:hypothetical protein
MHLLQSNVDLNMIRSWLGHASIETTHGYVEIDLEMKRKTLRSCEKLLPNNCFPELLKHQTAEERLTTIAIAKAAWRRSRQAAQLGIASVLAPGNPARSSPSGAATPPAALSRRPQLPSTKSRSTIAPPCPSHLILGYPPRFANNFRIDTSSNQCWGTDRCLASLPASPGSPQYVTPLPKTWRKESSDRAKVQ